MRHFSFRRDQCVYETSGSALLGLRARGVGRRVRRRQETSSTSAEPASPAATPAGQKVDTATAGDVKGVVTLDGTAPKNEPIKMNADPVCVKQNTTPQFQETYVVGSDGKSLGNVFVYVKDGLGNYVFDTPTETGEDRSEELPLSSARVRHARRPAARDRQQRSDAAQHPRAAEGQHGVQQRPADPGHEDDAHLHERRK